MHPQPTFAHRSLQLACAVALAATCSTWLTACGGGDDTVAGAASATAASVTLTGTAATGAPIANANLVATNAKGEQVTVRTAADGSYTVSIADAAPYLLSITDTAGKVWYSYAAQQGVANITPLTTLALLDSNGKKPLADLAKNWASANLSSAAVLASAAKVNANLQTLMAANGLDAKTYNVFATPFSANHTGFDAVLDATRITLDCTLTSCTERILSPAGSVLVTWNGNIATTGISLSWTATTSSGGTTGGTVTANLGSCKAPKAGTYSLVVQTSVAGLGGLTVPEVCIDGLPAAPASQTEFCSGADVNAQLPPGVSIKSCTFSGNSGTITAQITTPVVLDYTVTYTFVKN